MQLTRFAIWLLVSPSIVASWARPALRQAALLKSNDAKSTAARTHSSRRLSNASSLVGAEAYVSNSSSDESVFFQQLFDRLVYYEWHEPCVVIACTSLLCFGVFLVRSTSANRLVTGDLNPIEAKHDSSQLERPELTSQARWLKTLAIASFALLLFQFVLGTFAQSLTLMADSAHTAADAIGFGFAFYAECAKRDLEKGSRKNRATCVDICSALLSIGVVLIPSMLAMWEAGVRLRRHDKSGGSEIEPGVAETDFRVMGTALLFFAVISTVVNMSLMLTHFRQVAHDPPTNCVQLLPKPAEESCPPPPPLPAVASIEVELPPPTLLPPPPPLPLANVTSDKGALRKARMPREERQAKPIRQGSLKILHMAFHPGCNDQACTMTHGDTCGLDRRVQTHANEAVALEESSLDSRQSLNLNVHGALLHVATDVVRSIVIFVAGIFVLAGILPDPKRADAGCAIVVGICVIAGSWAMFRSIAAHCLQLARRRE